MKFSRQEAEEFLASIGVETPNKAQVSALLDKVKSYSEDAIGEAVKVAKEETEANIRKEYEGYKSNEDYLKIETELNNLKDSNAKQLRFAKFKENGIAEKWYEHADSTIGKDEKDYDKRLADYVKNNPELLVKKEEPKQQNPFSFKIGGTNNEGGQVENPNKSINDLIRGK